MATHQQILHNKTLNRIFGLGLWQCVHATPVRADSHQAVLQHQKLKGFGPHKPWYPQGQIVLRSRQGLTPTHSFRSPEHQGHRVHLVLMMISGAIESSVDDDHNGVCR